MSFSYSRVSTFKECPYKYKLKYVDKLEAKQDMSPSNALFFGTATHEGIEHRSVEKALDSYMSHFPEITDAHKVEMWKLQTILPKAFEQIPEGEYEKVLRGKDGFVGFIDCIISNEDGTVDILDFKTSNNVSGYLKSAQLHIYKHYFEELTGKKVRDLYYVFIPKFKDVLNESATQEDIEKIKQRIVEYFADKDIRFEKVEFSEEQVESFLKMKDEMQSATEFPKQYTTLCKWCDYKNFCSSKGADLSELTDESRKKYLEKGFEKEVPLFE